MRITARCSPAHELSSRRSSSFARRRQRPSQPNHRSTIQRRGSTSKPFGPLGWVTISRSGASGIAARAWARWGPRYPPSAQTFCKLGRVVRSSARTAGAPSRSGTLAGGTCRTRGSPRVSTPACRVLPWILFPPSEPLGPPLSVVFTDGRSIPPRRRRRTPALQLPGRTPQRRHEIPIQARVPPPVKLVPDRRSRGKTRRERTPLATRHPRVQQRIHPFAQVYLTGTTRRRRGRKQRLQTSPFRVGPIAFEAVSPTRILRTSGLAPSHGILPMSLPATS